MDRGAIEDLVYKFNNLCYTDKSEVFQRIFSLGRFGTDEFSEKLVLISLVALVTSKMKEKDPSITPLQVLIKITGQTKDNSGFYQSLENLAALVEDTSYGCTKFDPCGCKNSTEIINTIKSILSTWLPF